MPLYKHSWTPSNDGAGSGLDADLLDGNQATAFYLASNPSGYTTNAGTVTSVSGTGTVSGLTLSGTVTTSGNLTLGGTLSVTASNFSSQSAKTFLAAPSGAAGVPTFRTIVAADIPTLNQNTTGSAATLATGRTIGMTGDVTWTSGSFDGSANVTGTATLANSGATAGTYNNSQTQITPYTVDAKGRITSTGSAVTITPAWSSITGTPTTLSGYGITDAISTTSSGTINGVLTLNSTNDFQLQLTSGNTWTGIAFDDNNANTGNIWHHGVTDTFAIGGGGSSVSGKQLHIHGGVTIGSGYATNSTPTNGLSVEGNVRIGTTSSYGRISVASASSADSSIGAWSNAYSVFGPNAGTATGAALGLGYNTALDQSEIVSIAPSVAWKPLKILCNGLTLATDSGVTTATLSSSGNLGLGVTPSAWGSGGNLDLPTGCAIGFNVSGGVIASNAYYNAGWKYKATGTAAKYDQDQSAGAHYWYTAPSGTAGNAISFTQRMALDSTGLSVTGTTSATGKITSTYANGGGSDTPFSASHATGTGYGWSVTGQAVDGRNWDFIASGSTLALRTVNDANSAAANALRITRSGNTVSTVETYAAGAVVSTASSTGLAVTGVVSATNGVTAAKASTDALLKLERTSTSAGSGWLGSNATYSFLASNGALSNIGQLRITQDALASTAVLSSTGVAVTGTLSSTGSAGIGRGTNPTSRLIVRGLGATSATRGLVLENSSGTEYLTVADDGSVTVTGALSSTGRHAATSDQTTPTDGSAYFYKSTTGAVISGYQAVIETGSAGSRTTKVTVDNSGEVGIGTTSPASSLDITRAPDATYNSHILINSTTNAAKIAFNPTGVTSSGIGADATGLRFYASGANTVRATLDYSGNLGLGVTPSASWAAGTTAIQFGPSSALYNPGSGSRAILSSNAVFTTGVSSANYITSNAAAFYDQTNGAHKWYTAPSGTAGNAITFTQVMQINASGNWTLKQTDAGPFIWARDGRSASPTYAFWNDDQVGICNPAAGVLGFSTGNIERARIDASGNFGIGTTTPAHKLEVNGSFAATTKSFLIDHPTKPGMKLRYGSLESPYHGVRLTGEGKIKGKKEIIRLPEYITGLCKQEGAQVQITSYKNNKVISVEHIDVNGNYFVVSIDRWFFDKKEYSFFWSFTAVRKDIEDMIVEF